MAWSARHVEVLIATPNSGNDVYFEWAINLAQVYKHAPPSTFIVTAPEPQIDTAREKLSEMALNLKANYIFWLDSDVLPPVDVIDRLIRVSKKHNAPIVSGLYARRYHPCFNEMMIWSKDDKGNEGFMSIGEGQYEKDALVVADAVGFGCVLVKTDILKSIEKPWFRWTEHKVLAGGMSEDFFFCFTPGQYVTTPTIPTPIEQINEGDVVISSKGSRHNVTHKFVRPYTGDVIVVRPTYSLPLTMTPNHPVLVSRWIGTGTSHKRIGFGGKEVDVPVGHIQNMWVRADEISKNDRMYIPKFRRAGNPREMIPLGNYNESITGPHPNLLPNDIRLDNDALFLLGLFTSEGYIGRQSTICLSTEENSIADRAEGIIVDKFGLNTRRKQQGGALQVITDSLAFGRFLQNTIGKGAMNKHFPDFWPQISKEGLCNFIQGCWIGDGCIRPPSDERLVNYGTVSPVLARQMHQALLNMGIMNGITEAYMDKKHGVNHPYCISIPRIEQEHFRDIVPFVPLLPYDDKKGAHFKFQSMNKGYWVGIRSINRVPYSGNVYNLEVDGNHTYVVEGIAVHNCKRAREAGYKIVVDTSVVCKHMGPIKILPSLGAQGLFEFKNPGSVWSDL